MFNGYGNDRVLDPEEILLPVVLSIDDSNTIIISYSQLTDQFYFLAEDRKISYKHMFSK